MNRRLVLFAAGLVLGVGMVYATPAKHTKKAKPAPTATAGPTAQPTAAEPALDWTAWFKDGNGSFKDKVEYLYFAWFAQDARPWLEKGDTRLRFAQGAVELVSRLGPKETSGRLLKVDIAYITAKDEYGMPKWDSLKKAAHLEGTLANVKALAAKPQPWTAEDLRLAFPVFNTF